MTMLSNGTNFRRSEPRLEADLSIKKDIMCDAERTPLIESRSDVIAVDTADDDDEEDTELFHNEWAFSTNEYNGRDCNKNVVFERFGKSHGKSTRVTGGGTKANVWLILIKKKRVIFVIAALLIFCIVNTSQDRIPVFHHSHAPEMKDNNKTICERIFNETCSTNNTLASRNLPISRIIKPDVSELTTGDLPPITTIAYFNNIYKNSSTTIMPPSGYLVWSERCKIPNFDPYLPEVMTFFKREKYESCSSTKLLTQLKFNETSQRYVIQINNDFIGKYSKSGGGIDCCYQVIERNSTGENADKEISLSACVSFLKSVELAETVDNVLVKCKSKGKQVYINGYPMMPMRDEIQQRLNEWKSKNATKNATSVLLIGIDSISRINLIRAMPKTAQYLYDNEWFEMSGYNKVADNTFPNLMPLLTGLKEKTAFSKCSPLTVGGLDGCSFIWNTFKKYGYVTAYAEDAAFIATFNYLKPGFLKRPVDYYLRPFFLSAEKNLRTKLKSNLIFCLGYQHSADYVFDYALEMATRYKDSPFFGLFWANSFSHNAISDCSSMDERIAQYLHEFSERGVLDRSIVIFFSDHGMRFGPTRKTLSGHFEERLPFLFIWVPPHLKNSNPDIASALSVNKNRLTNPYDIHMTLKHILQMSGRVEDNELSPAEDCPNCQSLFRPVPQNRSCEDIEIEDHWCTCIAYQSVNENSNLIKNLAKAIVAHINNYVAVYTNGSVSNPCAKLILADVQKAYRAQQTSTNSSAGQQHETYRMMFTTKPNQALFEATVRYNSKTDNLQITGEISRLNTYASDSHCISDPITKMYCSCKKKKGW